jgi:hypothetical protein
VIVIGDAVADFLEAVGLAVLWRSQAPFYAAELQVLRAVDCCLREETACFGDMEDRVEHMLADTVSLAASEMTDAERGAFFPIWDQLEEHVQLYVLNGHNELPPMKCGPSDCTMRKRRKVAVTHSGGSGIN